MPANKLDLVLYDFFQKLKKELGMELDMKQYQLLLAHIMANPVRKHNDLLFVCQTLLLTHEKYRNEFNNYFNQAIANLPLFADAFKEKVIESPKIAPPSKSGATPIAETENSPKAAGAEPIIEQEPEIKVPETLANNDQKEIIINIKNSGGVGPSLASNKETNDQNFILNEVKYLPFDKRAMEQGWRKLRGKSKYILTDKLDFTALFKRQNEKGGIDQLIYERESIGMQKVIWFSDHGGSMAPFSYWDQELFTIMKNVPNTDHVEHYYFHDYPSKRVNENLDDFLFFTNRTHTGAKFLSNILRKANKNSVFIFFSDGGAARKQDDMTRVEIFFDMVNMIKAKSRNVYFINPVKNLGMSAGKYISFFVKTEFPSNKGIRKILQPN